MNPDQKIAYDIGYKTAVVGVVPGGKARLDKTAFTVNNAMSSFGGNFALAESLYSYYIMGFSQAQTDMANQNTTPPFPESQVRLFIENQFARLKRSYTVAEIQNYMTLAKEDWKRMGAGADIEVVNTKMRARLNSLPPQQDVPAGATSEQVDNAVAGVGGVDNLATIVSTNLTGASNPGASNVISGSLQKLSTGTYTLYCSLDLQASLLQEANKILLGSSADSMLKQLAAAQSETTLPIANRRVKILAFNSADTVPYIQKQWTVNFEVLEDSIEVEDAVQGFATLAGVSPQFLKNVNIQKKSETVSGTVGTSSSPLIVVAIVAVVIAAVLSAK